MVDIKQFMLRLWYMSWVSQYNKRYSRPAIRKLIDKIKKHKDDNTYKKITVYDEIELEYDNIYQLIQTIKDFLKDCRDRRIGLNRYFVGHMREVYALDFFTVRNGKYIEPGNVLDVLIEKTEALLEESEKGEESYVSIKTRYSDPILLNVFNVLHFYYNKRIDGHVLDDF